MKITKKVQKEVNGLIQSVINLWELQFGLIAFVNLLQVPKTSKIELNKAILKLFVFIGIDTNKITVSSLKITLANYFYSDSFISADSGKLVKLVTDKDGAEIEQEIKKFEFKLILDSYKYEFILNNESEEQKIKRIDKETNYTLRKGYRKELNSYKRDLSEKAILLSDNLENLKQLNIELINCKVEADKKKLNKSLLTLEGAIDTLQTKIAEIKADIKAKELQIKEAK